MFTISSLWVLTLVVSSAQLDPATIRSTLFGYDCLKPTVVETIDGTGTRECLTAAELDDGTKKRIQIVRSRYRGRSEIMVCSGTAELTINDCGMHSHSSFIRTIQDYELPMNAQECHHLVSKGWVTLNGPGPTGRQNYTLSIGATGKITGSYRVGGKITNDNGGCSGGEFTIDGRRYDSAVATVDFTVIVGRAWAQFDLKAGQLRFNGIALDLAAGFGKLLRNQFAVWDSPSEECSGVRALESLWVGDAYFFTSGTMTVAVASSDDLSGAQFGLAIKRPVRVCGTSLVTTDIQGIYMTEMISYDLPPVTDDLTVMDYVKTTFSSVHYGALRSRKAVAAQFAYALCKQRRDLISMWMQMLRNKPFTFEQTPITEDTTFGMAAGELIYIVDCQREKFLVRPTEQCHTDIPVFRVVGGNYSSAFLSPVSRLLKADSPIVPCSPLTEFGVKDARVEGWAGLSPGRSNIRTPRLLDPNLDLAIVLGGAASIPWIERGLLSEEQLEMISRQAAFGHQTSVVQANLTWAMSGHTLGGAPAGNLGVDSLYPVSFEDWLGQQVSGIWRGFIKFGEVSAGFLGIYGICCILGGIWVRFRRFMLVRSVYGILKSLLIACFESKWDRHLVRGIDSVRLRAPDVTTPSPLGREEAKVGGDDPHKVVSPEAVYSGLGPTGPSGPPRPAVYPTLPRPREGVRFT